MKQSKKPACFQGLCSTVNDFKDESAHAQALEFEAGQRNWLLQQDALHAAASARLRQEVAASQAAVEAQRTNQLADWAAEEQEQALKQHQASRVPTALPCPTLPCPAPPCAILPWLTLPCPALLAALHVLGPVTALHCRPVAVAS